MDTLGERILTARKNKGWTQPQLAEQLGVNLKNVSRWELDQSRPSIEAAADLAKVLDVSLDYLGGLQDPDTDTELLSLLNKVHDFTPEDQQTVKRVIEGLQKLQG